MDPILLDFPDSFETERLLIRSPQFGDGEELNAAVVDSLAELQPWMPWAQKAPTLEESEVNVRQGRIRFLAREDLWLLLFLKGTDTLVGGSGLHRMDWKIPSFEIGYWIRTSFAGEGYITEAVNGVIDFAFNTLNAKRLTILCDERNDKSAAVAKRVGFELEGTHHYDTRDPMGALRNTLHFAKVLQEIG